MNADTHTVTAREVITQNLGQNCPTHRDTPATLIIIETHVMAVDGRTREQSTAGCTECLSR